jgi:hypothetical protein
MPGRALLWESRAEISHCVTLETGPDPRMTVVRAVSTFGEAALFFFFSEEHFLTSNRVRFNEKYSSA